MVQRQRLLAPHVLAGRDDPPADLRVRGREREVHDDLDLVHREQIVDGAVVRHAVLLGARARPVEVDVGDEQDLEVRHRRHVLEIRARDDARADDADADAAGAAGHLSFSCSQASDAAMPSNTSPA